MSLSNCPKERKELEDYFNILYKEDLSKINKIAGEYSDNNKDKFEGFIEGYKYSLKSPHTKLIRLIVMYTLDYIPYYKKVPTIKNITTKIRGIFNDIRKNEQSSYNSGCPREEILEGSNSK